MAVQTKAIKGRIKSISNTKKITKAMEMVAAAKMRRAVEAALATREYAVLAKELFDKLAYLDNPQVPLLQTRPVKRILAILVSSNRGLCGSFNANLFKRSAELLSDTKSLSRHRIQDDLAEERKDKIKIDLLGIGKKTAVFAHRYGYDLKALYDDIGEKPRYQDVLPIAKGIIQEFCGGAYDKVVLLYTNYINSLNQTAKVRQLLPISSIDLEKMIQSAGKDLSPSASLSFETKFEVPIQTYYFEPSLDEIISYVLPRLVETQIYQALLESAASEHSARMIAMKNASDNARDLIKELTLHFNKVRQAGITQEIAEIAGGAAALE